MAQQTSVEWLFETMAKTPMTEWYQVLEQAKEMEKEEMHKCASFWRGKENDIEKPIFDEYYNKTYNND
jgi:hypothetical protein